MHKGSHIIANFHLSNPDKLLEYSDCKSFLKDQVNLLDLNLIGEIFHNFSPHGFTGVLCLSESHISIHTFPELNYCTFDIYLSNHTQDNSAKGQEIYAKLNEYFSPVSIEFNQLNR